MDDKTKIVISLLMMEFVYTRDFKDDSKRGFTKDHLNGDILANGVFMDILTRFQEDCLNHELTDESKTLIAMVDTLYKGSEPSVELKEDASNFLKSIFPEELNSLL